MELRRSKKRVSTDYVRIPSRIISLFRRCLAPYVSGIKLSFVSIHTRAHAPGVLFCLYYARTIVEQLLFYRLVAFKSFKEFKWPERARALCLRAPPPPPPTESKPYYIVMRPAFLCSAASPLTLRILVWKIKKK